jgi:hypothetical protein
MTSQIQDIKIYKDNFIGITVKCPHCETINEHGIGHATIKNPHDKVILKIDFNNLGQRCCHNTDCWNDYYLYNK